MCRLPATGCSVAGNRTLIAGRSATGPAVYPSACAGTASACCGEARSEESPGAGDGVSGGGTVAWSERIASVEVGMSGSRSVLAPRWAARMAVIAGMGAIVVPGQGRPVEVSGRTQRRCRTPHRPGVHQRPRVRQQRLVGAYAAVVQSPAYRDDKVRTTLQMLPDLLTHQYGPRLAVRAGARPSSSRRRYWSATTPTARTTRPGWAGTGWTPATSGCSASRSTARRRRRECSEVTGRPGSHS